MIAFDGEIHHGAGNVARLDARRRPALPHSAGVMSLGGSYMGATDMPGSGSRPTVYHSPNITAKTISGSSTTGLLCTNHHDARQLAGFVQDAFGDENVRRQAGAHGQRIGGLEAGGGVADLGHHLLLARAVDAGEALRAQLPGGVGGNMISAVAWSMGTGQSLPVTFQ